MSSACWKQPSSRRTIPHGARDAAANAGRVNIGIAHGTAAFIVASIRRRCQARVGHDYARPPSGRLLTFDKVVHHGRTTGTTLHPSQAVPCEHGPVRQVRRPTRAGVVLAVLALSLRRTAE
ncbi:ISAzo13-like element transposase-related protein [Streptomyces fulvorobeus]|uniref:Uncharacterized protein n=1 Tax=Streptomyces fulvorobeus TaxID=284028 RepID=A0A7Y9L161_9ACTN|nr:hypothetical protein [Streptomyces fulvorobeus]NYE44668.1 hypothetical protein [Streptomyces fulvorobeus]